MGDEKIIRARDNSSNWNKYIAIIEIPILHKGWEMDNEYYLAKDKEDNIVYIQSGHGGLYLVEKEVFMNSIQEKKKEYEDAIEIFKKVLNIIEN